MKSLTRGQGDEIKQKGQVIATFYISKLNTGFRKNGYDRQWYNIC